MLPDIYKNVVEYVTKKLKEGSIPFQITGGLAAIAYGAKRIPCDIDIDVYKKDIPKVRKIFKEHIKDDYYHLQDENFDIWLLTLNIYGIDVDISQSEEYFYIGKNGTKMRMEPDLTKAKEINIDGLEVPVEEKEELIAHKKILSREVDLIDIKQIS